VSSPEPKWSVVFLPKAQKAFEKLDRQAATRIAVVLNTRIAQLDDPRSVGAALSGGLNGLWKYRVGDYRIVSRIEDNTVTILVVSVGHRSEIYR
jgi:mRNA interferase RelE/StbE